MKDIIYYTVVFIMVVAALFFICTWIAVMVSDNTPASLDWHKMEPY